MAVRQNDSETSVGGLWWKPGDDEHRFSGTLTLRDRRFPSLFAIDPPLEVVDPGSPLPVLHGMVDDLGAVSLLNCVWGGFRLSGSHTVTLRATTAVTGVYLDGPDDVAWRRVEVVVPALGALLGPSGQPRGRHGRSSRTITIATDRSRHSWKSAATGVTTTLQYQPSSTVSPLGTTVRMIPIITLQHPRRQSTEFWMFGWAQPLNQLLELACGTQVNPESVSLWPHVDAHGIQRERTRCRAYLQGVGGRQDAPREEPMFRAPHLSRDPEQIARIVTGVSTLTRDHAVFTSLVLDAVRYTERPIRNRFVDVVSGLEAFHSVVHGRGPIEPDEFKQRRKDVITRLKTSDLSASDAQFIRKWLEPSSRYALTHRLKALGTEFSIDTSRWSVTRDRIAELRNDIAHGSSTAASEELQTAYEQVMNLARRIALAKAGIPVPTP